MSASEEYPQLVIGKWVGYENAEGEVVLRLSIGVRLAADAEPIGVALPFCQLANAIALLSARIAEAVKDSELRAGPDKKE